LKKDNKSLNAILESYQSIEIKIVENDGVIDKDIEQLLEINESDLKDKLDGYQGFIKYLEGQVNYLKIMEAHYLKRRKVLEKSIQRCKDSMVGAFSVADKKKIKTSNYNFSLCQSESWTVNLDSIDNDSKNELIDKGLAESILKLSMNAIKIEYKTTPESDRPKWIDIKKNPYIRVS